MGRLRRRLFWVPALVAIAADAAHALPTQADICVEGRVDKARLADFVLDSAHVSRTVERWAQANPGSFSNLTAAQRIIVDEDLCGADTPAAARRCVGEDEANRRIAWATVRNLLSQATAYRNVSGTLDPYGFFANPQAQLMCITQADGSATVAIPAPIPAPFNVDRVPLRLRASADGLQFRRNDSAFAGLERANLTFRDDDANAKESLKITALIGLSVLDTRIDRQIIPYFGVTLDSTRKDGQPRSDSTDSLRAGMLLGYRFPWLGGNHWLLARPEYAANRLEHSEVVSANITYMPVFNRRLNDAINIHDNLGRNLFSIIPRADLRLNIGHFVDQGTRADEDSVDFIRMGFQAGFSIVSDLGWLPAELTVTETYLRALRGNPANLSQLRAVLSLSFDKNKYFGVDLGYTRGRREDLLLREDVWSLGLGARF
jgi:hypothetical protein